MASQKLILRIHVLAVSLVTVTCFTSPHSIASGQDNASQELGELSVEDLTRVKITSVSKRPESLAGAAAAIHVVTDDDIKRQGATTIADSLRYVPGMQVAQINSHSWAISSRGFANEYATKLLVLMDGRSVYTPLNAGVYWDTVDMMLEDLERVEVIRGPGGTLWGANAVNGVINITSKSSRDTQGWLLSGGGGTENRGFTGIRFGGKVSEDTFYRVYGKYNSYDETALTDGSDAADDWQMWRTGFRIDSGTDQTDLFTLQGDYYHGEETWLYSEPIPTPPFDQNVNRENRFRGANLIGRWTHSSEDESQSILQSYLDYSDRQSNLPSEKRHTFDLDLQHHFAQINSHNIVMGVGYRFTQDEIRSNFANSFSPDERSLNLFSGFLQDEITLINDVLRFTVGSKVEHNDFTGVEYQPSGRIAWTPSDYHTIWTSISRAVRTPSRAEEDVRVNRNAPNPPFPPGSIVSILGNDNGLSEKLIAYEVGYRTLPISKLSFDTTAFLNVYNDLRSIEPGAPASIPPTPVVTYYSENQIKGESWGAEVATDWQALDWWKIRATYSYAKLNLETTEGGTDQATIQLLEGNTPEHQFTLRSQMDVSRDVTFDVGLRYVDSLKDPHIPAYTTMDVRLAWKPKPNLEISLIGLNLIEPQHAEFAATQVATPQREVRRSVYGKITWRF